MVAEENLNTIIYATSILETIKDYNIPIVISDDKRNLIHLNYAANSSNNHFYYQCINLACSSEENRKDRRISFGIDN